MWVIWRRELANFFASFTGYLVLLMFVVSTWLVLWIFPETSVLTYGYATLQPLFDIAPWLFLLLSAVLTGRQLAEEQRLQTIELLLTRPVSLAAILLGKFLAVITMMGVALLLTVPYAIALAWLATPVGNVDVSAMIGSYVGLWLMTWVFSACGLLLSALTDSQVIAVVATVFANFFLYYGFMGISQLPIFTGKIDWYLQWLSLAYHYQTLAQGVLDTRHLFFFVSLSGLFLFWTHLLVEARR